MMRWGRGFVFDLRSLALFRITLGLLLLTDLALRLQDTSFFLTELGPYPLTAWVGETYQGNLPFSLYGMCTYSAWPYLLLALTSVAILFLIAGRHLLWTVPSLWILYVSLQNRSMISLDAGDKLLRELLLLGAFLAWGELWVWKSKSEPKNSWCQQSRAVGIGLYVCLVTTYLCAFLARLEWLRVGDPGVFSPEKLMAAQSGWPAQQTWFATALIVLTAWQALGSILLVFTRRWSRVLVIVLLALSGATSALMFDIGMAPWVGVAALIPWLPAFVWGDEGGESSGFSEVLRWKTLWIGLSVASYAALTCLSYLPSPLWPEGLKGWTYFTGGAPRGGVVLPWPRREFYHYEAVATDIEGKEWEVNATTSLWEQTYRRRRYLQGLEVEWNWELRDWMALDLYRKERRRLKGKRLKNVRLFQTWNAHAPDSSGRRLWAEWPVSEAPRKK